MVRATYTASEAARALGISLDTLRRWDRQGRIHVERDAANRRVVAGAEIERLRGAEQHVFQPISDALGVEGLGAHNVVGLQGFHDGVHDFLLEIRRVRELLFGVVGGLLLQRFGFEQFAHDHIVHVNELVLRRQLAFE